MRNLEICISIAFNYRLLPKPKALKGVLAALDPSVNKETTRFDFVASLIGWRLQTADKLKKDFNRPPRLLPDDKTVRIILRHSSPFVVS